MPTLDKKTFMKNFEKKATASGSKEEMSAEPVGKKSADISKTTVKSTAKKTEEKTAARKTEEKPSTVNSKKSTEKKTEVKKVEEKKTETKKAVVKKPAASKPAVKKAETKKPEAKAAAPVKKAATPAKKAVEPKTTVMIEYSGKKAVAKDVLAKAMKDFKKRNKDAELKSIEVYLKPEENAAYYVANGEGKPEYKVSLF